MSHNMGRTRISLSMKRQAPLRGIGDPPNLGRVERVGRGGKIGSRRRRQRGSGPRSVRGGSILIFSITILAIVVTFTIWLHQRRQQNIISEFEKGSKSRVVEKVKSRFEPPTDEQARAIVTRALSSKDEAAVLADFRLNGVASSEVLEFLRREEDMYGPAYIDSWLGSIDSNNALVESVVVKRVKDGETKSMIAMLTPDQQGTWRLDFESFVSKCEPTWETFVSGEATAGLVRVWLNNDNYYNGPFIDDVEWLCFSMARIDSDVILFGYCRKGSPQADAIEKIAARMRMKGMTNATSFRAILEISRPEGAEKRQFEIRRVLAEDWLLTGAAFDGSPGPLK